MLRGGLLQLTVSSTWTESLRSTHSYSSTSIIKSVLFIINTHLLSSICLHRLVLLCSRSELSQSAVARVWITFVKDFSSRVCIQTPSSRITTNSAKERNLRRKASSFEPHLVFTVLSGLLLAVVSIPVWRLSFWPCDTSNESDKHSDCHHYSFNYSSYILSPLSTTTPCFTRLLSNILPLVGGMSQSFPFVKMFGHLVSP